MRSPEGERRPPFDPELLNALKIIADNGCTDRNDPDRACDEMLDYPKAKWCPVCIATHAVEEIYRLAAALPRSPAPEKEKP